MTQTITPPIDYDAGPNDSDQRLARLEAQTKSIHGWVVVIGWIVTIQFTLGLLSGAFLIGRTVQARHVAKDRVACVQSAASSTDALDCFN